MASRNKLINGPITGEEQKERKYNGGYLYDSITATPLFFKDKAEFRAALESGKWLDSPAKVKRSIILPNSNNGLIITPDSGNTEKRKLLSLMNLHELLDYGRSALGLDMLGITTKDSARETIIAAEQGLK